MEEGEDDGSISKLGGAEDFFTMEKGGKKRMISSEPERESC